MRQEAAKLQRRRLLRLRIGLLNPAAGLWLGLWLGLGLAFGLGNGVGSRTHRLAHPYAIAA